MADLSDDDIRHLASLARISVSDEEVALFRPQLASLLEYVDQLNQVDTTGLEPTSQVTGLTDVARADDDTSDTMDRDRLLDQVPDKQDGQIKVPKVL